MLLGVKTLFANLLAPISNVFHGNFPNVVHLHGIHFVDYSRLVHGLKYQDDVLTADVKIANNVEKVTSVSTNLPKTAKLEKYERNVIKQ